MQIDFNQVMLLLLASLAGFAFNQIKAPGREAVKQVREQDEQFKQIGLALLGAAGLYFFKQLEARGDKQEDIRVMLASMESRLNEQIRTLFTEIDSLKKEVHRPHTQTRSR